MALPGPLNECHAILLRCTEVRTGGDLVGFHEPTVPVLDQARSLRGISAELHDRFLPINFKNSSFSSREGSCGGSLSPW